MILAPGCESLVIDSHDIPSASFVSDIPPESIDAQRGDVDSTCVHFIDALWTQRQEIPEIGVRHLGSNDDRRYFLKQAMRVDIDDGSSCAANVDLLATLSRMHQAGHPASLRPQLHVRLP